jgi:hypothetical protein
MLRLIAAHLIVLAHLARGIVGANQNPNYQPPSQPPQGGQGGSSASGMAVVTLIMGIGAWTFLPVIGAFVGVVTGWLELNKIKKGQSPQSGETIAKVGFWLSVASIAMTVLGTCASVVAAVFIFGGWAAMMAAIGLAGA